MSMKVAEAGVILAGSSNQTNFTLWTSKAGVAPDQRLKLGQLAFQAKWFPLSVPFVPFILLPVLGRPEPEGRFSCVSCCGSACAQAS